jgi:hypothetical protein
MQQRIDMIKTITARKAMPATIISDVKLSLSTARNYPAASSADCVCESFKNLKV